MMKLLHTADWHLCDRLGRIDRTEDLRRRVEKVAQLCQEHAVDVLLMAGDLFSEQASIDQMTDSLNHIRTVFEPFFRNRGTILAVTGNHDRDGKINIVRAGMTLAAPVPGQDGILAPGRMYLINGRAMAQLQDRAGQRTQFVLTPYPFSSRYDLSATEYRTREEENQLLHGLVVNWLQEISQQLDVTLPTVLCAHLHVRGSSAHTLYKMSERDDILFSVAELNPMWSYLALGHIHQPQALGGSSHIQYAGSLDRLDFGETHQEHGVTLVEVEQNGTARTERILLPATPFHTIVLEDPALEMETLLERYPEREQAIVRFRLAPPRGQISREEIARRLKKDFPRWYELKWNDVPVTGQARPALFDPQQGMEQRVQDYLGKQFAGHPHRDELLRLAQSLLDEWRNT
ncbi:MAG TPA: exonuclease subunit SbcD [Gemmatales bacterium]|nr:exonuclease subunit SbcD [Gemmatales bacterium]